MKSPNIEIATLKYKLIFLFLYGSFSNICHANWVPAQPISAAYAPSYSSAFTSCDSSRGAFLATWADEKNDLCPTYSFYTPKRGWSPIGTISNRSSAVITGNVVTSCNPLAGIFIATWTDSDTYQPNSSIYTPGSGWSPADPLTIGSSAADHTNNSLDSSTGKFLITWADRNNNYYPTYSFYTPGVGWGPIATISTHSKTSNVYTSFDPATNRFLAVWADRSSGLPMYAFYTSGAWSSAAPISLSTSVDNEVFCTYNPITMQFFAAWADINQNFYPFYSIYTPGNGWSSIDTITTSSGVTGNVAISCALTTGKIIASWSNVSNGAPIYSFYTPGAGWCQPKTISTISKTAGDIITCFNSMTDQFLAAWSDTSTPDLIFNPTYSFFIDSPPPPSTFSGSVKKPLKRRGVIHQLTWTPPVNSSSIVSYQISRNNVLIATVPASGPFVYNDLNRSKKRMDIYTIVSVNGDGRQSVPLSVALP